MGRQAVELQCAVKATMFAFAYVDDPLRLIPKVTMATPMVMAQRHHEAIRDRPTSPALYMATFDAPRLHYDDAAMREFQALVRSAKL